MNIDEDINFKILNLNFLKMSCWILTYQWVPTVTIVITKFTIVADVFLLTRTTINSVNSRVVRTWFIWSCAHVSQSVTNLSLITKFSINWTEASCSWYRFSWTWKVILEIGNFVFLFQPEQLSMFDQQVPSLLGSHMSPELQIFLLPQ